MFTRKAIECAVVVLCFVAMACNDGVDQAQPDNTQDKRTEHSQEVNKKLQDTKGSLAAAAAALGRAQTALSRPSAVSARPQNNPAPRRTQATTSVSPSNPTKTQGPVVQVPDLSGAAKEVTGAVNSLEQANSAFDFLNAALLAGPVSAETQTALGEVKTGIDNALSKLKDVTNELSALLNESEENVTKDSLEKAKGDLKEAQGDIESATKSATRINVPTRLDAPLSFFGQLLSDWGTIIAIALGAVFALILLIFGAKALARSISGELDKKLGSGVQPVLVSIHKQQKELATQLSSLTSSNNDLHSRITDVQSEVRSVGRLVRDASLDNGSRRPSVSVESYQQTEQSPPRDEPAFPISTVDYLGKMQRFALVVKPDFQNGILVTDSDGKGELALIRDSKIDDDLQPLFVVPTAAQFQTKQDFHTYYEKYYDCARPSAGDVWIVEPAVVSKVQGGWLLREKGVLEIR